MMMKAVLEVSPKDLPGYVRSLKYALRYGWGHPTVLMMKLRIARKALSKLSSR